jgi:hypothetical protein
MKPISQQVVFKPAPSVRESETQDGAVLLDIEQGQCFSMNPVAAMIWKQLGQGCDPMEIAQNLARTFDISLDHASSDVEELVQRLRHVNLLRDPKAAERQPIGSRSLKAVSRLLRNLRQRKNAKSN